jgi:hypothetical protein
MPQTGSYRSGLMTLPLTAVPEIPDCPQFPVHPAVAAYIRLLAKDTSEMPAPASTRLDAPAPDCDGRLAVHHGDH